jgi:hypothetical protein
VGAEAADGVEADRQSGRKLQDILKKMQSWTVAVAGESQLIQCFLFLYSIYIILPGAHVSTKIFILSYSILLQDCVRFIETSKSKPKPMDKLISSFQT